MINIKVNSVSKTETIQPQRFYLLLKHFYLGKFVIICSYKKKRAVSIKIFSTLTECGID